MKLTPKSQTGERFEIEVTEADGALYLANVSRTPGAEKVCARIRPSAQPDPPRRALMALAQAAQREPLDTRARHVRQRSKAQPASSSATASQ